MCCNPSERSVETILEDIENLVEATEPEPRPKSRAFQPFPVSELPNDVRKYVVQCAESSGYDVSFVVLPLLSTLASAIGNSTRIALNSEWEAPSVLWTVIVGESGTMKSPALKHALKPIRKIQRARFKEYRRECQEYERQILESRASPSCAGSKDPSCASGPPTKPVAARFCVQDTTVEALMVTLEQNPKGVLLVKDELSGWFAFGTYKRGGGKDDVAHWLQMYDADELINDRKGSGTMYIPYGAVSIAGGIQPNVLKRVIGQEHRDNGLFARFLIADPPRRAKQWREAKVDPALSMEMDLLFENLCGLKMNLNEQGEQCPFILQLNPGAKELWVQFVNEHGREQLDYTGDRAAALVKLEGAAARLALIHFLVRVVSGESVADPHSVDETSVRAGIRMARWFKDEMLRVYDLQAESDEEADLRTMRELIERRGGAVSIRDWQRLRSHPTSAEAREELSVLVDAGQAESFKIPPGPNGGRRSDGVCLNGFQPHSDTTP